MQNFVDCFILPEPSTSSESGVKLDFFGPDITIQFDYDRDGVFYNSGIIFKSVRSFYFVAEMHCPAWKIEKSYDKLIVIENSLSVKKILENTVEDMKGEWELNHYMIYFDSCGCYEAICSSWAIIGEKSGVL